MLFGLIITTFLCSALQLDQSAIGLSREYLVKGIEDKIVSAYYDYMVDLAVIYGADRERATKELMDSLNFEIALANVSFEEATELRGSWIKH